MLMPILTVKTPVAAAQAAVLVEAVTPRERTLPVSMPGRISGNQSEAVLKILETLNRHLLESEPLPKDALIRLLDTLAKILKFPPLPQETLRDFSKRLAVFLETLPPAARLALEKQLGQHNLAISIRILTEALRMPSIIDMPRLLDRPWVPLTAPRAGTAQPDSKPLQTQTPPQGQTPVPGRQTPVPAAQTIMAGPAVIPDPGLLQAALKKAFSDDETGPAVIAFEESLDNESPAATLRADQPAKAQTARGSGSALASGQPPQPSRANAESIPLLRAAAAFLAADPEALSLVAAIAAGDMDAGLKAKLAEELGLDLSEPMETPEQPEHSAGTNRPGSGIEDDAFRTSEGEPDGPANTGTSSARPTATRDLQDVDGFKGHDLGEWELEIVPENQSLAGTNETPSPLAEAEMGHPEKSLAQTLKALVEASLPLPGSVPDGSDTLFAALAGETADIGAEILFAQLEAADTAEMPPDTSLLTGDTGDRMEMAGLEHDSWSAMLEGPEETPGNRPTPMHAATMEESAREALTPRLPDAGIARDAIPFAMIPYPPAKTQETRATEIEEEEEEEQAAFSGEDNEDEGQNREERGEQEDHTTAVPRTDLEDEESQAADAYDLYRRMGGYG